jgi:hypothetical protein
MVFPLVPVVALAGALFLGKGYDKKACASNAAFVTLLYAVSHVRLITLFVKVFLVLNDAPPAWALPLPTLMNISGLHGFLVPDNAFFAFALISNLIVASALLYQVIREKTTSFLSLSLLTFVALNMIFCAYYYKPGDVRSYSAFKSVMSLSFVIMIFLFRFIDCQLGDFLSRQRDAECGSGIACLIGGAKLPLAATLTAAVFLMMNAYASVTMRRHIASLRGTDVSKIDSALKIFSESPFYGDRNFIINFDEPLMQDLSEYYLPFGRVYSTRNDGRGSRYGVRMVESFNSGDIYASHASYERVARTTDAKDVLFESEVYKVFQLNENSLLLYEYAGMSEKVFIASKDGEFATLRPLIDTKAGPRILCLKERTADVSFSFYDGDVPGSPRGKIYVNGEYRGEAAFDDGYMNVKLEGVAMKRGVNDFIVEFDGDVSNVSLTGLEMF